jgi:serine/threonine protein phosphatase PrpC
MKFTIFRESRKGERKENQDRIGYSFSRDAMLMVVADGMGGHLHGEVASHIAVQFLTEAFEREAMPTLRDPFLFLHRSITNAHHALVDYARARALKETPRTTCVACVVQDAVAYWAHVGDSRLYHVRDGRIDAQTKDHSRVQMLVTQGRMREEAVAAHPERNRIFNCVGGASPPQVELSKKTALRKGDTLILCTDGLWGPLSGKIIAAALLKDDIMKAMPQLLDAAELRAGGEADNLSVIAMTWTASETGAEVGEISTQTVEMDGFTTQLEDFGGSLYDQTGLTEEEIERAIEEIRDAIGKNTPEKPR